VTALGELLSDQDRRRLEEFAARIGPETPREPLNADGRRLAPVRQSEAK
jgi:hypothetical protein